MTKSLIGQKLGKYTITEKIGRGGMAEVYKAHHETLGRDVAIKVMHAHLLDEENFLARFQREARTMARLNHPHIVRVYDFDTFGRDNHYIVMDYIGGGSLKERLEQLAAEGRRMTLERTVKIIAQIADALAYAHQRDMVHRDIKPANIMLDEEGEPFLTDFGIVKMLGGQTMQYTATGALIGTPDYMSPEQALGKSGDKRSDIYSLGILLFQMSTGQLPFNADTPVAVVMKHVSEPVPLPVTFNPDVPQALQTVILKALAKEPEHRFQGVGEMAAALRRIDLSGMPATDVVPAQPPPPPPTVPPTAVTPQPPPRDDTPIAATIPTQPQQRKKRRWPWVLAVLILLLIGGGTAVFGPKLSLFGGSAISVVMTATPSVTPVPTNTAIPSPTDTLMPTDPPDTVATVLAAAAQTATAQAPVGDVAETAVATEPPTPTAAPSATPEPTQTATPTATLTPTAVSNSSGTAHTGNGAPLQFETFGTWVRGDEDNGTFTQSAAQVHSGSHAAKLSYDFGGSGNDYVVFLQLNSIGGTPNALQVWVYGDGSGHYLNAWIVDSAGETWQTSLGRVTHTGWRQMTGYIATGQEWPWGHISGPSNDKIDYPITFRGFVLDDYNNDYTGQGTIYLDDLTATTANVGSVPTAPATTPIAAATTAVVNPSDVGRILYTSSDSLMTADPDWSAPK
ncbi:MAG: protein kinase, partial [Chloroflexi bacterium]|nr:protein kinase [Chloroflexota bacterium]